MNREELDKELDEWLDRAAAEYGKADARPGFEARAIANLNGRLEKSKWYFRWIPIAAAVAAVLFFSIYALRNNFQDHGKAEIASIKPAEPKSGPKQSFDQGPAGNAVVPAAKKPARGLHSSQPSGRFLSSGLSDQERYLIAFARAASEQNITGLSEDQKFEPLQIPEMEIPEFNLPDFEITSFEIEELHTPTPGSEEKLWSEE
jgi:hypothetical protein